MKSFTDAFHRLAAGGTAIGGIFLIAAMLLLIGNILGRFINFVIPGSYELFELCMVIPVSVALVYCAVSSAHVVVNLLTSRFPPMFAAICEIAMALLSCAIWGFTAYAGGVLAFENGLREVSDILEIPYLPFRIAWVLSLFIFSGVYIFDAFRIIRRLFRT